VNKRHIKYGASETERDYYQSLVKQHGSPLLVVSRSKLLEQFHTLQRYLPGVELYYAIKAFPHSEIIRLLAEAGCHFDVASEGEIDLLKPLQVSGRRTIHTHPIKKDSDIRAALRGGSTTFVVDNIDELKKLIPYRQRIGLLLRVSFRSDTATVDLSRKFGCAPEQVKSLVIQARELGVHIRGLSFHVGSQSTSSDTHVNAIQRCSALITEINAELNNPMNVLDIGGGFPVDYAQSGLDMDAFFKPISEALNVLPDDINVIAEPGRFLVAPAAFSISTVSGKAKRGDYQWYYMDDGIYGCYSGQLFDHVTYPLQILNSDENRQASILAGPTCDSIDIIAEDIALPDLAEGDLLIGHMMGAYTHATATRFNSLAGAKVIFVD
jgi:ornithine decarboxylase